MSSIKEDSRDDHSKWSDTKEDKYHDISWRWILKIDTNEPVYQTETDSQHRKSPYGYQKGKLVGKGNETVEMNIHRWLFVK